MPTVEQFKITRDELVEIFQLLEFHAANKWSNEKLLARLKELPDSIGDDFAIESEKLSDEDLNRVNNTLDDLLSYVVDGEVIIQDEEEETETEETKGETEVSTETKSIEELQAELERLQSENEQLKAKKTRKRGDGVTRNARTRNYVAGTIIGKHGMDGGVTKEMCDELGKQYGGKEKDGSELNMNTLRQTWHSIRGFLEAQQEEE